MRVEGRPVLSHVLVKAKSQRSDWSSLDFKQEAQLP